MMRIDYTLRKAAVLFMVWLVSMAVQGQTKSAGPFYEEGPQLTIDVRHMKWSDFEGILPRRNATTRGEGTAMRWIDRIGNMPDYLNDFYQEYGEKVKEVINGGSNWLSDPTQGEYNSYTGVYSTPITTLSGSVDFTFPAGSNDDVIAQKAGAAVDSKIDNMWNEANCFLHYLTLCLNYDFPEAFWRGNSSSWSYGCGYDYYYNTSAGTGTVEYAFNLTFTLLANGFDFRIDGFQTPEAISSAVTEFNEKVKSVTDMVSGKKRIEQVVGLNDWLTMHNCYNSDLLETGTANEIAWSPLSALRESVGPLGPVCEGYARAFKVLCDKLSIPCMLATGNAKNDQSDQGEAHMWNEVQMDDNNWYAVDVTWNDPTVGVNQKVSGAENHNWLLLGKNDEVASGFTFAESHPNTPVQDNPYQSEWEVLFTSLIADNHYVPGNYEPTEDEPGDNEPVLISISAAKQVAYCSDKDLDFSSKPELKAYVATGYDKTTGTIWLTKVKDVPANTGFLLMGEAGDYEVPVMEGGSNSYYMNMFQGTLEAKTIQTTETVGLKECTNYYLSNGDQGVGFYKVTKEGGVSLAANRAYLPIPTEIPADGEDGGTETIKVSAAGQLPLYSYNCLDFTNVENVKAYTATGYDYKSGTIWLTRVKKVPYKTGILIIADEGEYPIPTASMACVYENMFVGTGTGKTIMPTETYVCVEYINYYLSKGDYGVGFYKVKDEGVALGANRCYLRIPQREAITRGIDDDPTSFRIQKSDEVIGLRLIGSADGTTGIETINREPLTNNHWYTLQGQRVAKPGKGLYIRNGKKVVIR